LKKVIGLFFIIYIIKIKNKIETMKI